MAEAWLGKAGLGGLGDLVGEGGLASPKEHCFMARAAHVAGQKIDQRTDKYLEDKHENSIIEQMKD